MLVARPDEGQGPKAPGDDRALVDEPDHRGLTLLDPHPGAAHEHLERVARAHGEADPLPLHRDEQAAAPHLEPEGESRPGHRQARVEGQRAVVVAQSTETVDERVPHPTGRRDVHAVCGIAVQIGEVDEEAGVEVLAGEVAIAHLCGDDRLNDGGQGGVSRRQRVVVLEVGELLLIGEELTL